MPPPLQSPGPPPVAPSETSSLGPSSSSPMLTMPVSSPVDRLAMPSSPSAPRSPPDPEFPHEPTPAARASPASAGPQFPSARPMASEYAGGNVLAMVDGRHRAGRVGPRV